MKKSMKKLTGFVAAGVLAAGLLSGCGGSADTETQAQTAAAGAEGQTEAAQEADGQEAASAGEKRTLRVAMECAYAPYN